MQRTQHRASISESSSNFTAGERQEHRLLLRRLLGSRTFHQAPRLREFLQFIEQWTANGGGPDEISEYDLGVAVFHRPPDFSPNEDNIVRVTARHLRAKLERYFQEEGAAESWLMEIPKGGYAPHFRRRAEAPPEMTPTPPETRRTALWKPAAWLGAGIALGAITIALLAPRRVQEARASSSPPNLVRKVIEANELPTLVVIADYSNVLFRAWASKAVSLEEYASAAHQSKEWLGRPLAPDTGRLHQLIAESPTTTIADVLLASRILMAAGGRSSSVTFQHARNVNARHFKDCNQIFLGGACANPWTRMFEPALEFEHVFAGAEGNGFRRKRPAPGQTPQYFNHSPAPGVNVTYARVASIANPLGGGRVLLVAGSSMVATEAAGDFVLSPNSYAGILERSELRGSGPLPDFEAMLVVEEKQGVSSRVTLAQVMPIRVEYAQRIPR